MSQSLESPLERLGSTTLLAREDNVGTYKTVLVDDDYDGEYFSQYKWCVLSNGYVARVTRVTEPRIKKDGSVRLIPDAGNSRVYLHHLVLPPKKGYWRTFKNGNPLDCRSANVIYKTPKDSALQREVFPTKSPRMPNGPRKSPYRGAYKNGKTWAVRVVNQGEAYYRSGFKTAEDAARAYDNKAREYWGSLAILNFPGPNERGEKDGN